MEPITREQFLNLTHRFVEENGRERICTTPRNYKIDVYHSRELNEIPLEIIIKTRSAIPVDKRCTTVNAICLEGLIASKYRTNRGQDREDLRLIAMYRYGDIDWKRLRTFAKSDLEFGQIATAMKFYKENPMG